jgi:hypothetical protein
MCSEYEMCNSFFSTAFVQKIFCSDKYTKSSGEIVTNKIRIQMVEQVFVKFSSINFHEHFPVVLK